MFGDNLKLYRIKNGYSQNDLAEKLFVSRQCISKWEKGITQPDIETLNRISEILGVSVDRLVSETETSTSPQKSNLNFYLAVANILFGLFSALSVFALWRFLPTTIPAHWTGGVIDRYGSKNEIFLNILPFAVFIFTDIAVYFALRRRGGERVITIVHALSLILQTAYFIFVLVLYAKYSANVIQFVTLVCIALFLCLSVAVHPKICGQNLIFGVRTNETLSSPEIWNKTNALFSYLLAGISVILYAVNMIFEINLSCLLLLAYLLPAVVAVIYAKLLSRKTKKTE